MSDRAKLFTNGRSQAVRLPRKYRFEGEEVRIWRSGERVILEPLELSEWPVGFWEQFDKDEEFTVPQALPSKDIDI